MKESTAKVRSKEAVRSGQQQKRLRLLMFIFGDGLFLILLGVAASLTMYLVHSLMTYLFDSRVWILVLSLVFGMSLAMIFQNLLAFAVAPILGSIESMVPSMVVAIIVPVLFCSLALVGINVNRSGAVALGAAGGISIFIFIKAYAWRCRKSLHFTFAQKGG